MRVVFFIMLAATAITGCTNGTATTKLPILGNREAATRTVNGKQVTDTVYQTIPAFKFVNQFGDTVTNKSLDGTIYVADFFFTTCPNICPVMHRNMLSVYDAFKTVPDFKIISHTIDPKHDSVAVLKSYADKLGIKGKGWLLLRGDKNATYKLAKNYMVDARDGNVHDGYFILIDKQKRIRGSYLGTDAEQVSKMILDIKVLQAEPEQQKAQ